MFFHGGTNSRRIDDYLDFSANTSPLGVHKAASRALLALSLDPGILASYPDPACSELKEVLAKYWEFDGPILCGSGAADLTQLISMVFGKNVSGTAFNLIVEPAFSEYENALLMACDEEKILHLTLHEKNEFKFTEEDFKRLEKILSGGVPLMFMASPSNPAGNVLPFEMIERIAKLCEQWNTVFVLDSCFCQFSKLAEDNVRALIKRTDEFPHLIILNAFTKFYGMAGLRLGYALCFSSQIYNPLVNAMRPWTISTDAQVTGVAVIKSEIESDSWHKQMRKLVEEERAYLSRVFENLGIKVLNGEGNYILIQLSETHQKIALDFAGSYVHEKEKKGHNGPKKQSLVNEVSMDLSEEDSPNPFRAPLCQALGTFKIVIRGCSDFYGMDSSWYRVSIKNHEENTHLVRAVEKIFKK
ncbi:pyridoxal phosphate-dependent aminotransferase [Treponema pectinovorum]|uniref:pyridoxal phosphate-dependent aminotransferase n=1 Tax=Treponema pectinovorum TaxID=164 RepID=UPI0011C7983C|nr:histidinol-phosphate transaminase [Treponema pectinovorum]